METESKTIQVEVSIGAPREKVWELFTQPKHIEKWNNASDDWFTPHAKNDLRVGGKFTSRMEAKDGSFGFDYYGVYDAVIEKEYIEYTLGDQRKVKISFTTEGDETKVVEIFEPESTHPPEFQKAGWQAILDNFKKYVETNWPT